MNALWERLPEPLVRLIRYGLVGGLSTVLYFIAYTGLILLGAPFVLAALAGFAISAVNGYWLHHHWTFETRAPTGENFARWVVLQGSVLGANIGLLALLVHAAGLNRIVAQAILLPVIPLTTFVLSRRLVFAGPAAS